MTEKEHSYFSVLPQELLLEIFTYLGEFEDILSLYEIEEYGILLSLG